MEFCFLLLMAKTQSAKFKIENLNGKNNFEIWKVKMHDLLVQQGVVKALLGRSKQPYPMTDDEWNELDGRALSGIWLCLADDFCLTSCQRKLLLVCGQSWRSCTWKNPWPIGFFWSDNCTVCVWRKVQPSLIIWMSLILSWCN